MDRASLFDLTRHTGNVYTPAWVSGLIMVLLVVAPVSSKLAGLLFLVIVGLSLWLVRSRPSFGLEPDVMRDWIYIAAAAMFMRLACTVFWTDSWGARHFEIRFFVMAIAGWAIVKRCPLSLEQKTWITHALAMSCGVALAVALIFGRNVPSNPLPWAAGVSFLVCVLSGRALVAVTSKAGRVWWWLGIFAGSAAIFVSKTRGSYAVLPWVLLMLCFGLRGLSRKFGKLVFWQTLALMMTVTVVAQLSYPRLMDAPMERVQEAVHETAELTNAMRKGQVTKDELNTSVGARLYIWVRGVEELQDHWIAGVGEHQRQVWVKQLGAEKDSELIASLAHLHSDPLTIWFEHGLLGIASYLTVTFGLLWLSWRSVKHDMGLALGLAGLTFMHLMAGLTNFNTSHNVYGVMLSVSTFLAFWLGSPDCQQQVHSDVKRHERT